MDNPFYRLAEFPDFTKLTPEAADAAFPVLLADTRAALDRLEAEARPEWESFVRTLNDAQRPLRRAWGMVSHMLSVCNCEGWRRLEEKYQPQMVEIFLRAGQSRRFYELAKTTPAATPVRRRILEKMAQAAELSGVALAPEKQARFNAIQAELAKLASDYHNHVLDATKAFSLELTKPEDVAGLPRQTRAAMAGANDPDAGPWTATIEDALYAPFMEHCRNRAAREKLFRARAVRAASGALDNTPLIARILELRREMANLLGYPDYAALSIAEKSAGSTAAVERMIDELARASETPAAREDRELADFAAQAGFEGALQPWDRPFWAERMREALYSYSEEELSEYFDLPQTLEGLFALTERLFGVSVRERELPAPAWHPDVRLYEVSENGTVIAHFYFDPYSRPGSKSGGAWMNEFASRELRPDGAVALPVAVICCNQALPDAQGRALMRFREVETLFHEFGHALQHMLTRVDDIDAAGINLVEWDAVEIASQFMENWCTDAAAVRSFARRAGTGEPIPEQLVAKVRAAKNFRAARASLRQLSFAKLDLELHKGAVADPNALKEQIFAEWAPGASVPEDRFLNAFSHIFAGGYAAGYYSYKWSEVMSADVFGAFEEAGPGDPAEMRETGRRYRETFLALGGGTPPGEVFRRFRGRDPSIAALLRQTGLA